MPTTLHPVATWLIGAALLGVFLVVGPYFNLWLQTRFGDAAVPFRTILQLRLRGLDVRAIVLSHIRLVKAGIDRPLADLEAHVIAGGRLPIVVQSVIFAERAGVALSWAEACAIDLRGQDVLAIVKGSAGDREQAAKAAT